MATFYSDIASIQAAQNSGATGPARSVHNRADGKFTSGNMHLLLATYTTTTGTDETTSDDIYLARGIVGATYVLAKGQCWVEAGTSTALAGTVGYNYDSSTTDDADLLTDGLTLDSEGLVDFAPNVQEAFWTCDEAGWIYFKPTTVTSIVASKKIQFIIPFILSV